MNSPLIRQAFEFTLLITLLLSVGLQLYFYLRYFLLLAKYKVPTEDTEHQVAVSLIIAARNEKPNLQKNLPLLLGQQGVEFEIVLVDDHSTDGLEAWIKSLDHASIHYHQLKEGEGKKAAVQKGIALAKYEHLLFTDADCRPSSSHWMKRMGRKLNNVNSLVLGHGRYEKQEGFLNALIRFETYQTAVQYFSFALNGKAYMGVGRNLAYHKQLFQASGSFSKHAAIRSGDDDLFVNEMGEKADVKVCIQPESHTVSTPKSRWKDYIVQKRRHLQAGEYYKAKDKLRLALLGLAKLMFWISFLLLLLFGGYFNIIFIIFAIKLMLQYYIDGRIMKQLKDIDLLWWSPLLEGIHILLITGIGVSTWIWKVDRWK